MRLAVLVACTLFLLQGCAQARVMTASWYSVASLRREGTWSHSRGRMANGELFQDKGLTCAARLWGLGTRVRVTNLANSASVVVRVTDRVGKRFEGKRIDLSKEAFSEIASLNRGLIKVKVEVL